MTFGASAFASASAAAPGESLQGQPASPYAWKSGQKPADVGAWNVTGVGETTLQ